MKWKKWLPAVLAVVLGGVAAKIARDSLLKNRHIETVSVKLVQVAVANANMLAGHDLKPSDITTISVTTPTPPPDTFTNPADLVGRIVLAPVLKGQTILGENLAPKGLPPALATLIPPGKRAITIQVDEINGQAGMLTAGCRVDFVTTIASGKDGQKNSMATHTLLKDVLVQAIGQRVMPRSEDPKEPPVAYHTLTLIVTPREGELIHLAAMTARVHLMLRGTNRDDSEEKDPGYVCAADLIGEGDKIVAEASDHPTTQPSENRLVAKSTPKWTVEVIKAGGAAQKQEFELPPQPAAQVDTSDQRGLVLPEANEKSQE